MNRREAVRRVSLLLGGVVSAPALSGVLAGCRVDPSEPAYVLRSLSSGQNELVTSIAEHIIPETDTPGARQARVNAFIDSMLTEWYPVDERDRFLAGLDGVDVQAQETYGDRFLDCSAEQQVDLVTALDQAAFSGENNDSLRPFFRTMKELTLLGYYTSEAGAVEELRWQAIPGRYDGCVPLAETGRMSV